MRLELKKAVEVLLFVHDHPLSIGDFQKIIGAEARRDEVEECLAALSRELALADKPFSLEHISGGYQLLTRPEYEGLIRRLVEVKKQESLTRTQLETLAVIAYSQPVTKGEVDSIRGVNCAPAVKVLQERGFIQTAGRAERLGAPLLYATSQRFLEVFGLKDAGELPEREDVLQTLRERIKARKSESPPPEPAHAAPQ